MRSFLSRLIGDKQVNGWALLILAVGLGVLGGAVHFVHGYQVRRNAEGMFDYAQELERAGNRADAARALEQYLGLNPKDIDALQHYGKLLAEMATNRKAKVRAYLTLEQVLRRKEKLSVPQLAVDARRTAARLAIDIGRFGDARDHLDALKKEVPVDVSLMLDYARALS